MTFASDYFERDIANHVMEVIRDDGVNRHLRFRRPGTMCMHFDLITWPGYLCYTGDMGTYVFRRLHDMFQFFRRGDNREQYSMDRRYWAEKLEAADKGDGVREWTAEKFRAEVRDYFEQAHDEDDDPAAMAALWQEIEEQVCAAADYGEHHAWVALSEFEQEVNTPGESLLPRHTNMTASFSLPDNNLGPIPRACLRPENMEIASIQINDLGIDSKQVAARPVT